MSPRSSLLFRVAPAAFLLGLGACDRRKPPPAPASPLPPVSGDWPAWGGGPSRNMVSYGTNPPVEFDPGKRLKGTDEVNLLTTEGLKWAALLGSQSYGTPVIAGGRVLVGTNNENPRDPKYAKDDRSVLMCLDEKNGALLWQMPSVKLGTGKINDYEYQGLCSPATVEGERVFIITNRCAVVCLDLKGMKDGNQGLQDEVQYYSSGKCPITATGDTDADILWRFDMREECGVFPHNMTVSNVLILGDRLYANTSNGTDWTHQSIPAPNAPALICLEKTTGRLLGEESSGISKNVMHVSWSSPAYAETGGRGQIIFGAGDGFCYAFDLSFRTNSEGFDVFNELWRCDANPQRLRFDEAGRRRPYFTSDGPSEIIASPVIYKERVYTLIGQEPEHGEGPGCLTCIDLSGKPVWTYTGIDRSISTPAIADDVVHAADYTGRLQAIDALTGAHLWTYDTKAHIWSSPYYIDGKIYIGNEEGELHIISAGRVGGKRIKVIDFPGSLNLPVVYANHTLYVVTASNLYAFGN